MEEAELWKGYRNTREKGKLREPAQAMAVAKCLLSRLVGERKGENKLLPWDMHPKPCTMCKIDSGKLMAIYEEWMEWSGLNDPANMHKTLIMFQELPRETQRQETRKAQGYVDALTGRGREGAGSSASPGVEDDDDSGLGKERSPNQRRTHIDGVSGGVPRGRKQQLTNSVDAEDA